MIRDLAELDDGTHARGADVVVVGAGIAGLLMAHALTRQGLDVLVLESGGTRQDEDRHPLNEVVQLGQTYLGAEEGRFRCLGGTSTRWGGAMLPFLPPDMERHSAGWDVDWPVGYAEVAGYLPEIEALFGLPGGSYEIDDVVRPRDDTASALLTRFAKWPSFRRRNIAQVLAAQLRQDRLEVWLNAHVVELAIDQAGHATGVTAAAMGSGTAPGGARLAVRARVTVLAAGAIECTRLLLLADAARQNRIFAPDGVLGRYFHDHLSAPVARVVPRDPRALNMVTGFRFQGGGMRNLRFEPTVDLRQRLGLAAGFAHIAFDSETAGGFDALRDIFRKAQNQMLPDARDLSRLLLDLPWTLRAVYWRMMNRRLLFPGGAELLLHVVSEQRPDAANAIGLSRTRRDPFGCPLAELDWRVRPADLAAFTELTRFFLSGLADSSLSDLATIEAFPEARWSDAVSAAGGIYHPGGTCRMGRDRSRGVVDGDLRTFAVEGLRVASTAVFPSGGSANPTLMLMLFTLRAADSIAGELGRRASA